MIDRENLNWSKHNEQTDKVIEAFQFDFELRSELCIRKSDIKLLDLNAEGPDSKLEN